MKQQKIEKASNELFHNLDDAIHNFTKDNDMEGDDGFIILVALSGVLKKLGMVCEITDEQIAEDIKALLMGGLEMDRRDHINLVEGSYVDDLTRKMFYGNELSIDS